MSRFEPVHLPEDRKLHDRASQTMLRHFNGCPRSGYLYQLFKGEASTPEMQRGSALHAVIERSIRAAVAADERTIPPELVKAIVNEVLADPEFAVPIREHDYLREAAYRWGAEFVIDPGMVVALETLFVLDIDGFQVRAKIDYAELVDGGAAVAVRDWKSSRALPSFEDVARKRPDGSMAAKNFQLILYALALAFGVPVRTEDGVEIPEPFGVAARAQRFDLAFVYPGIEERSTGRMATRPMTLTRLELDEYRQSLAALVGRLRHAEDTGDWPAVASDDACPECPARSLCPIPAELRDHRGAVNTPEEAAEAAERLYRDRDEHKARLKELREYAKAHGPILFGNGMVWDFGFTESERIADKDGMWQAIDRAVSYGEPFSRADYVKVSSSTPFAARRLTAAEIEELTTSKTEGSDGSTEQLDERYGADAPF